MVKLGSYSAL